MNKRGMFLILVIIVFIAVMLLCTMGKVEAAGNHISETRMSNGVVCYTKGDNISCVKL